MATKNDSPLAVLRRALGGFRGDLTVADAAARSGLSLADAESALRALLVDVDSHLAATDQGELVYSFPRGLHARRSGSFWLRAWTVAKGAGAIVGRAVVRSFVGVFLVGYALVFALLLFIASLAAAIAAEDSAPAEAAGYLLWGTLHLLVEALYWSVHPLAAYEPDKAFKGDRKKHTASFYQRVNNFFFGPSTPDEDPLADTKRVLARIRAKKGRIGILDVMQAASVDRAAADAILAKLLLDYEGDVDVTDDGAIVYRFEKLRKTTQTPGAFGRGPRPKALPELSPLTNNSAGANATVIALVLFNLAMGWLGMTLDLTPWLGAVPFFGSAALLAFPIVRALARPFQVSSVQMKRARERVRALAVEGAREGVTETELAEAFAAEAKRNPKEGELTQLLTGVAQEIDVVNDPVPLMDGSERDRFRYRFRDLEAEVRALEAERAAAPAHEREVGEIVFSSRD